MPRVNGTHNELQVNDLCWCSQVDLQMDDTGSQRAAMLAASNNRNKLPQLHVGGKVSGFGVGWMHNTTCKTG
jgi:hypothetical protein